MERKMREYEAARLEAARAAAKLLLASAVTAPRIGGVDVVSVHPIEEKDDIVDLAIYVEKMADDNPRWDFFRSEAVKIRESDVVLLMADRRSGHDPMDSNCNLCGYMICDEWRNAEKLPEEPSVAFRGPFCLLRSMNSVYALNAAVTLARQLGIDHAISYPAGAAAVRMGLLPHRCGLAFGMLISVTEKSPFRDLPLKWDEYNNETLQNRLINRLFPVFRSIYC